MISVNPEMVWVWMQGRAERGKPSVAHAALMPIYKLVLGACLAFRFSEDIEVMLAEALLS